MTSTVYDVITIGGGAAGLLAAATASEAGRRVLLLEKNRRPGVKILMSGGTRCNITQATDAAGIVAAFGKQGKFLHSPLAALPPQGVVDLFEAEGVPTKVEATGKIFPVSDKAADVLAALTRRLRRSGAELAAGEAVVDLRQALPADGAGRFTVATEQRSLAARSVILTTGGRSYPGCGTTGDGYAWAEALGHTIVPTRPALVPIAAGEAWVADLKGVTVPDVAVAVVDPGKEASRPLAHERGSFLFTHFGLSGPTVMNVSRAVTSHPRPESLRLECDFLPSVGLEEAESRLTELFAVSGKKQLANLSPGALPERLWLTLLSLSVIPATSRAAELAKSARSQLVRQLKRTSISIAGTRGFKKAEVTAGGVDLREVDSRTMQSKLVPGLYLAGEILDLDGPIGGYNFQAAFSTGYLAGVHSSAI